MAGSRPWDSYGETEAPPRLGGIDVIDQIRAGDVMEKVVIKEVEG